MAEQVHEDIILKENKGKYEKPWIIEYVVEERNKDKTFEDIANELKERGETSITANVCSTLYKQALARTMTTSTQAKDDFIDFTHELKEIYGDAIKLMGNYVKTLRTINEEISKATPVNEDGSIDILTTQLLISKQIPQAVGLMKEVREYVKNQIGLYDIVQQTQEKDVVWSESKMLEYVKEFLPTYLKELEKEEKIIIKDKSILK